MATIHVNRGGTSLGTFSEEEVREGLRSGRFVGTDLGWHEGMAQWEPLSQMPEFATTAPSGPPPAAPPIAAPLATSTSAEAMPRSGLPWDQRESSGFFNAFIETMKLVLTAPGAAFIAMKREGGFGEPLIYTITGESIGLLFYFIYHFFFSSLAGFGSRENPLGHMIGTGVGSLIFIILIPLFIVIGAFLGSAILHLCLMIVGGAKQSYETTFRVVCFAGGSVGPLMVIPFCGSAVAGVWKLVLYCIGLARAHETDTGRAVLAVVLPLIVCCGGVFLLAMLLGFGAWGLSQQH
jgi:hypothetical protein